MKKAYRVCKSYEFTSIIQHRSFVLSSSFVCYYMPRKESHARVGISVGKKLGNAVVRNKVKRQVRSMVDDIYDFKIFLTCDDSVQLDRLKKREEDINSFTTIWLVKERAYFDKLDINNNKVMIVNTNEYF